MALFPGPDSCVFYYKDWVCDGTTFLDSGPYGIHLTPVVFAAPTWGIGVNGKGQRYLDFPGGGAYAIAPAASAARFYAHAPTDALTFVAVLRYTPTVAGGRIFCSRNVAATRGLHLIFATVDRVQARGYDAAGATWTCTDALTSYFFQRTRVLVCAIDVRRQDFSIWLDGVNTITATQAAQNAIAYDAAAPVLLGQNEGLAGNDLVAKVFHVGLWPYAFSRSEALYTTDYWRERV